MYRMGNIFASIVVLSYQIHMWSVWDVASWEFLMLQCIAINVIKQTEVKLSPFPRRKVERMRMIRQQQDYMHRGALGGVKRNITIVVRKFVVQSVLFARNACFARTAVTVIADIDYVIDSSLFRHCKQ